MTKKIVIFSILFFLLALPVLAQSTVSTTDNNLPKPGLTPDHPLYFLDEWIEQIDLALTFDVEKKPQKLMRFADEKLAEVKEMSESKKDKVLKRKEKLIDRALKLQEKYQKKAEEQADKAEKMGKKVEALKEKITENFLRHQEVLEKVLEKVPVEARASIEKNINKSKVRYEARLEKLDSAKKKTLEKKFEKRTEALKKVKEARQKKMQSQKKPKK